MKLRNVVLVTRHFFKRSVTLITLVHDVGRFARFLSRSRAVCIAAFVFPFVMFLKFRAPVAG